MTVCLDSWAVLRWLEGVEPAASLVEAALEDQQPLMSWVNLGEVYYVAHRRAGVEDARDVVRTLRSLLRLELPDESRVLEAATIKAAHALAYADAFALATAIAHHATLMTGDPEIIERGDPAWNVTDVR